VVAVASSGGRDPSLAPAWSRREEIAPSTGKDWLAPGKLPVIYCADFDQHHLKILILLGILGYRADLVS
jgi:hypothetical protein